MFFSSHVRIKPRLSSRPMLDNGWMPHPTCVVVVVVAVVVVVVVVVVVGVGRG